VPARNVGCATSRDFVPWRFCDAACWSSWLTLVSGVAETFTPTAKLLHAIRILPLVSCTLRKQTRRLPRSACAKSARNCREHVQQRT